MTTPALTHFVFVDLENVPVIDLGLVEGKPVHVTLMIGKNQKKMDLPLPRAGRPAGSRRAVFHRLQ